MKDVIELEHLKKIGFYKDGKLTNDYIDCYRFYDYYLSLYLDDLLHLTDLEEQVINGDIPLIPLKQEDKDEFQRLSPFKFFYIRNFLKIEKLIDEEIQFLKDRIKDKCFSYDDEVKKMIENSYKEVVKDHEGSDEVNVAYGDFSSGNFFAPNCAIVLGIRFDYQYEGNKDDSINWLKEYSERKTLASNLIKQVEGRAKDLNIVLKVFEFNVESPTISDTFFKSY